MRRREEVRDDPRAQEDRARDKTDSAGDNFHTLSDGEESLEHLDEQDLCYATDDNAEHEAMIGMREARKELQCATDSKVLKVVNV